MESGKKIICWNVNGLRAVLKKGFLDLLLEMDADIFGIQETKIQAHQLPEEIKAPGDYSAYWSFAERKGYSGTAVFSKEEPVNVKTGDFGFPVLEGEGRIVELEYPEFTLFNIYFPNGQMNDDRLQYKLDFYDCCLDYFNHLKDQGKNLVIMGDYNTAHKPIDLKHPKSNEDRSGFLPIEREWIDKFIANGYVDTFREFNQEPDQYTWWSYRMNAREKNVGWRIDYFFVSENFMDKVQDSTILPQIYGSDHCPIALTLKP